MEMTVTILSYTHLLFVYSQVFFVSMYNSTYRSTCICLVTTMFAVTVMLSRPKL